MQRVSPASDEALEAFGPAMQMAEAAMGFVPNSMKIMARSPALLQGFMALSGAILGPHERLPAGLRQMIAHVTSKAAGCNYCQAHTSEQAERKGVSAEKIDALWSYETSDLFSEGERAALALAQAAGAVPNQASDAHFEALKPHFSEDEMVEIVGVIALFGFLNRWNDTLATNLEDSPLAFAEAHLAGKGWEVGNHGG
jgi:uncharacterized peroxidase-related enzyme